MLWESSISRKAMSLLSTPPWVSSWKGPRQGRRIRHGHRYGVWGSSLGLWSDALMPWKTCVCCIWAVSAGCAGGRCSDGVAVTWVTGSLSWVNVEEKHMLNSCLEPVSFAILVSYMFIFKFIFKQTCENTLMFFWNIFLYRLCDQWLEVRFLFCLVSMHMAVSTEWSCFWNMNLSFCALC